MNATAAMLGVIAFLLLMCARNIDQTLGQINSNLERIAKNRNGGRVE